MIVFKINSKMPHKCLFAIGHKKRPPTLPIGRLFEKWLIFFRDIFDFLRRNKYNKNRK